MRITTRILLGMLVVLLCTRASLSQRIVTGTVKDQAGQPVIGATVVAKGTTSGTTTDANGSYTISIPMNSNILTISYLGYKPQDVTLGPNNVANVSLEEDVLGLSEVVVTALGIEERKKNLGTAVQQVDGSQLTQSGESNIVQALSGKAAGVQVQGAAGTPGAPSRIVIRGFRSIGLNNQPLFVVDGIPIDNSGGYTGQGGVDYSNRALDMNSNDVANITILKGPAASALYGSQGSNGVIIINTKRGQPGATKITFSSTVGFDGVSKYIDEQHLFTQGSGGVFGPATDPTGLSSPANRSWGARVDTFRLPDGSHLPIYDNQKDYFETGVTANNNISFSGGNDKSTYFISGSSWNQTGIIPNTKLNRYNILLKGDERISSWFKVSASASYIKTHQLAAQKGSNVSGVMLGLLRTPINFDDKNRQDSLAGYFGPSMYPNLVGPNANNYVNEDGSQRKYGAVFDNPYWTVFKNPYTSNVNRIVGNLGLIFDPLPWLNETVRVGLDDYVDNNQQIYAVGTANAPGGQVIEGRYHNQVLNLDALTTLSKQLSPSFSGTFIFGQNLRQNISDNLTVVTGDLLSPDFYNIGNTSSYSPAEKRITLRASAFYGILKLSYKDVLFVEGTGRNEYSSAFAKNKSFFYPSASVAWVFTSLNSASENKFLNYGKLRFAIASVGNPPDAYSGSTVFNTVDPLYIPPTLYNDGWLQYGLAGPYLNHGLYSYSNQLGNADLKPEHTASYEAGTELKFLRNRIGLDFTYYYSKTTDEILGVTLPSTSGFTSELINAASVENKGVEVVLNIEPIRTKDFSWDATINWSMNRSKVLKVNPPSTRYDIDFAGFGSPTNSAIVGKPYGEYYGYDWYRNPEGQVLINDDPTGTVYPGNSDYGYPLINYDSLRDLGDPNPKWLGSLINTITYKGISFTFLLDVRHGGLIWDGTYGALITYGRAEATANRDQPYVFDGVLASSENAKNNITVHPGEDWYGGNGGGFSDQGQQFLEDGGWVRLRQIGLSYTLNSSSFRKQTKLTSLTFGISGKNLWLSTKYRGGDPETLLDGSDTNGTGIEWFNSPNSKSIMFNLTLEL